MTWLVLTPGGVVVKSNPTWKEKKGEYQWTEEMTANSAVTLVWNHLDLYPYMIRVLCWGDMIIIATNHAAHTTFWALANDLHALETESSQPIMYGRFLSCSFSV